MMAHQHEYAGGIPQGFGEINGAYMQQAPMQQGHHMHQQGGQQSHGKGASQGAAGQQQRGGNAGAQGYANAAGGARGEHGSSPPNPNVSAGMSAASYAQHYGWASYGGQPMGAWGHMMPQGYQQSPQQHQPQQQGQPQGQQHGGAHHQQSYRQYGNSNAQAGNAGAEGNAHSWSS